MQVSYDIKRVSNQELCSRQHTVLTDTLHDRCNTWITAGGVAVDKEFVAILSFGLHHITKAIPSWLSKLLCTIRIIRESSFLLLTVRSSPDAAAVTTATDAALQNHPELKEAGVFLLELSDTAVLASRLQTLTALLDSAHDLLVKPSLQNFSATESEGITKLGTKFITLKELLTRSQLRQNATAETVIELRASLGDSLPQGVSDDVLTAAFVHTLRDILLVSHDSSPPTAQIEYLSDLDPERSGCARNALAKALGRNSNQPGFHVLSKELEECIAACLGPKAFGVRGTGSLLLQLARVMPADSVWAQTLLDALHSELLSSNSLQGILSLSGINIPHGIFSQPGTSTPQHREDLSAESRNVHKGGAGKLWEFPDTCVDVMGAAFQKANNLTPFAPHCKFRYHSMLRDGVPPSHMRMLMQYSGMTVITVTGQVWHSTVSSGVSFAESQNGWLGYSQSSISRAVVADNIAVLVRERKLLAVKDRAITQSAQSVAEVYFSNELRAE